LTKKWGEVSGLLIALNFFLLTAT